MAVDGTFPKANANADSIHAKASPARSLKRLDETIAECHRQLDEADAGSEDGADRGEDRGSGGKAQAQAVLAGKLAGKRGASDVGGRC